MNMSAAKSTILLDSCSGGDFTDGMPLAEYASRCSEQVDLASLWKVESGEAHKPQDGIVRVGRVQGDGSSPYISTMWTTQWDLSVDQTRYADALLRALDDVFQSERLADHAKTWDNTFVRACVLANLSEKTLHKDHALLVSWDFKAAPLWGRDLLYMIAAIECNGRDKSGTKRKDTQVFTYSYASVNDEYWVELAGKPQRESGRVRAQILFPSCDRVTVETKEDGGKKIILDHLMTTSVGGWVGPCIFNSFFKAPLIQANIHECAALREYIESCAEKILSTEKERT